MNYAAAAKVNGEWIMFGKQSKIDKMVAAARMGKLGGVIYWVEEKGVPVNAIESDSDLTALDAAVGGHYEDIAEYLVEKGAKVTDYTMQRAAICNNTEFLRYLVDKKYDIASALQTIFAFGSVPMLEVALKSGADMKPALERAAAEGQEAAVCFLVDHKVEVTEKALENARASGNQTIAELLALTRDPEEAARWKEKQKILTEGTIEEKAQLKVREMEEAAREICASDDAGRQARMETLRKVVGELEKGLNVLQQSPHVDFKYSANVDDVHEKAVIKTNIQGDLIPLRLEVSAEDPQTITEYTGNDEGYGMSAYYTAYFRGVKLTTQKFNDVSAAVDDVIEQAFAKNALKPANDTKPEKKAQTKKL